VALELVPVLWPGSKVSPCTSLGKPARRKGLATRPAKPTRPTNLRPGTRGRPSDTDPHQTRGSRTQDSKQNGHASVASLRTSPHGGNPPMEYASTDPTYSGMTSGPPDPRPRPRRHLRHADRRRTRGARPQATVTVPGTRLNPLLEGLGLSPGRIALYGVYYYGPRAGQ
jgi:hypothetical protein